MRRLFSIALVSIVSISLLWGVSPVFAQTEEEPTQVFAVSSELMGELEVSLTVQVAYSILQ